MWPFRKKKQAPEPPRTPIDKRDWNEDWKVGDTAECIVDGVKLRWSRNVLPWHRPALGQRLVVSGFSEDECDSGATIAYFLHFSDWPVKVETRGFRKVRPVSTEKSEVVERILNAKPGADRTRERA